MTYGELWLRSGGRWLFAGVAFLCLIVFAPTAWADTNFRDVPPSYWAYPAIHQLAVAGVVAGVPGGMFLPEAPITRAAFLKMLILAEGIPLERSAALTFRDVPADSWAYPYVATAVADGIAQGEGGGRFAPNQPLTRQDMALFVVRTLGLSTMAGGAPPPAVRDADGIAPYARGAVSVALQLGLFHGLPNGSFAPDRIATRAQASEVVATLLQLGRTGVESRLASLAQRVILDLPSTVPLGTSVPLHATVLGPGGEVLPVEPVWHSSSGTITGGNFLASAIGAARLVATVGDVTASATLIIRDSANRLALSLPASVVAGQPLTVEVSVYASTGPLSTDTGRLFQCSVRGPAGFTATQEVTDQAGVAFCRLLPKQSGSYAITVTSGTLPPVTGSVDVVPGPPAVLRLEARSTNVSGLSTQDPITASLYDAYGNLVPEASGQVLFSLAPPNLGSLSSASASLSGGRASVTFRPAIGRGAVQVTAVGPGGMRAAITLQVDVGPMLAWQSLPTAAVSAGTPVSVSVAAEDASARLLSGDNGRTIELVVAGPGGSETLSASDVGGVASFHWTETVAGTYTLTAKSPGSNPLGGATLIVTPGPLASVSLEPAPSFLLLPGATANLTAVVADVYGNPVSQSVPISITASGGAGTLNVLQTVATNGTRVATFTAGSVPGSETLTVSAPRLPSSTLSLTVEGNVVDALAGKGMWLMYHDLAYFGAGPIVNQAVKDGIRYLFLEVGSTYGHYDFWGQGQLATLLPMAHAHGIAVIAWIYDTLKNPAADLQLAEAAYGYSTPDGEHVDGLALDLETDSQMTPAVVGPFDAALRQALGPTALLIAVTYPPQDRPNYPFSVLSQSMNAIAPMDYWHNRPEPYTASQAAEFVQTSIAELRQLTGQPNLVISVIGQAYDMFSQSGVGIYNPSAAEIQAAMSAAATEGAIGFSLYRWGTATPAEWNAFVTTPFAPTGTAGNGS